jgi:hypothetical protein
MIFSRAGSDPVVRGDLDRDAEPLPDLLREVDGHAPGLAGGSVLGGEDEVAVVDGGADLTGRSEIGADGGRDVGHGARC